ncbi:hypothetical protein PGT21_027056 [Puccinia graminis f. sp. tritici]|uniref:Uncharacterized protein n=1 Tax=Puccinia graminis f. sp. tritici TaxID=56615 RepID=A0A5B0LYN4_PUCGR|nr:hypothetical protein PGT21_027056 [Puccinia graminis f. sp. tritici]
MISAFILHFLCFQIFPVAAGTNTVNDFQLHMPKGSQLQPPVGLKLKFLALGNGTQNYMCKKDPASGNALTWMPHGADATLFDISKDSSKAASLATAVMRGGKNHQAKPNLKSYPVLGKHYFTPTKPDMTLMPTFEINHMKIILRKARFFPSPLNSKRNVDWLQLNTIQGNFASRVYRTYTRGGKVPAPQCNTVNQIIKEPYATIYSFWA